MDATELLNELRNAGLVLTLRPAGDLHVAPRIALTDDHRSAIRAQRDALLQALRGEAKTPAASPLSPPRSSGNPLMTPEQGDECHAGGWDDAEIEAFQQREARFTRMGRVTDAENVAERLTLRDRQHDDRRMCLECAALADNRRCLVAERGRLTGSDRRIEPVPDNLQRCEGFALAPGLT